MRARSARASMLTSHPSSARSAGGQGRSSATYRRPGTIGSDSRLRPSTYLRRTRRQRASAYLVDRARPAGWVATRFTSRISVRWTRAETLRFVRATRAADRLTSSPRNEYPRKFDRTVVSATNGAEVHQASLFRVKFDADAGRLLPDQRENRAGIVPRAGDHEAVIAEGGPHPPGIASESMVEAERSHKREKHREGRPLDEPPLGHRHLPSREGVRPTPLAAFSGKSR